ncbi:hypothetical protein [Mucilaginibacter boryungensis]|uniref:DUF4185 domain-containing protein n=1 Tax=Mucilaginibacter boryungensis TaxID=768480 RepID=A0ABR9XER9_9SPHI|nr:hypothetical protein [Mucilaginibacter boryungensis]MBE9665494.1 hypothetical protein [Mucilaginibacter boryungensis]
MESKKRNSTRMVLNPRVITAVISAVALILMATVCILSCSKPDSAEKAVAVKGPNLKVNGAQLLPGGRAYFTSAIGHFQTSTSQTTWVRVVNYTFVAATGTVTADLSIWSSANQYGKTLITSHSCTVDGTAKNCSQYSPTGWIVGTSTNPVVHWSGTYTYNSTTGALHVDWPTVGSGAWEDWTVSDYPGKAISMLTYVSSSGTYGITNGYGFGSSKPFTYYYSINSVPRTDISGHTVNCSWDGLASVYTVAGSPQTEQFSLATGFGGNAIHYKGGQSPDACSSGCSVPSTGKTGIIYHLTGLNNSRQMAFNHHCACLPTLAQYPCYDGTIHPYAMMQVIDDNGVMQGLVGIHEQDQPGSVGFSYSINYWLYP